MASVTAAQHIHGIPLYTVERSTIQQAKRTDIHSGKHVLGTGAYKKIYAIAQPETLPGHVPSMHTQVLAIMSLQQAHRFSTPFIGPVPLPKRHLSYLEDLVSELHALSLTHNAPTALYFYQGKRSIEKVAIQMSRHVADLKNIFSRAPHNGECLLYVAKHLLLNMLQAHARNVAVCDLKPENVMLDRHGGIRLTDLGNATRANKCLQVEDYCTATFHPPTYVFSSVEPRNIKVVARHIDTWSIAVSLVAMATYAIPEMSLLKIRYRRKIEGRPYAYWSSREQTLYLNAWADGERVRDDYEQHYNTWYEHIRTLCGDEYAHLLRRCLVIDPTLRDQRLGELLDWLRIHASTDIPAPIAEHITRLFPPPLLPPIHASAAVVATKGDDYPVIDADVLSL